MISPSDPHPPSFAGPELLWLWRQLDVLVPSDYLWAAFDGHEVVSVPRRSLSLSSPALHFLAQSSAFRHPN